MPPEEIGTAYFRIRADTRAFAQEARSGVQSALRGESERATIPVRPTVNRGQAEQTIKRDLGGAVRSAATYIGGIFAAEQVFNFAKGAIGDAAAVQKAQESIRSEYGKSGAAVDRFAHGQATSFGISAAASVTASAKIGALLDNMHIAPNRSAEMSVGLQKVVGSLSQIKDVDPTAILNRLNTSLATGSTRGLRDLGIALDANTVKTYAFSHGIGTVTKDTATVTEKQLEWKKAQDAVTQLQDKGQRGTAAYAVAVNAAARAHEAYGKAVAGSEKPLTVAQKDQALYGLVTQNLPKYLDEAKKHSGDYANQVKVLSAEWANAQAELGEKLLPLATDFIGVVRDSVDFIRRYRTEFDALALGIAAASAAYATIKAAQFGYNLVTEAGTRVQKLFSGELMTSQGWMSKQAIQDRISVASKTAYTTAIAAGATEQEAQTAATQAGTVAQDELNASMLANPIGIVVVSVAALAFGLYELYEHSATARRIMNETWADLKKYGGEALGWIAHTGIPEVRAAIGAFVGWGQREWKRWGSDIKTVARDAWTYVISNVRADLRVVQDVIGLFGDIIHGRWGNIWGDVKKIAVDTVRAVIARFGHLPEDALKILERLGRYIKHEAGVLVGDAERLGKEMLNGIVHGIERAPGNIAGAIKDKVGGALSDVGSAFGIGSPSRVFAEQIGQPISDGIVLGAQTLHDDLRNQMVNQLQSLQTTYGPRWRQSFHVNVGSPIAQGVVQGTSGLGSSLASTITGAVQGALNTARAKFGIHSPSSVWAAQLGRPLAEGIVHGMGGLEQMLVSKVQSAASAALGAGISGPSGSAAVGANQRLGYQMMLAAGWGADQWGALQALWTRESGWNQYAKNPSSGAFGIPQELGHAVSSAYLAGDVRAQIAWGLDYIRARYGSPSAAWAHETQVGWYQGGGVVPGSHGEPQVAVVHGGEVVFTPEQMGLLSRRSIQIGQVVIQGGGAGEFMSELDAIARAIG